ncbi:MAG: phosphoribosylformylglycinamidine synthase, partial [Candidatus Izimaplasma sp.]|nr:phosphoribosylformylglycinamidine synthase [Candidatus Izimaplasma bacterium]
MKIRLMIERKYGFQTETQAIINDIFENLNIQLTSLRYIMIYDCFDFSNPLLDIAKTHVFAEANKDNLLPTLPKTKHQIVVEPLPGQFDQRADSAMQCVKLIEPASNVTITSAEGYFFDESLTNLELNSLKAYFINPVDSREKDLNVLQLPKMNTPKDIITYKHFNNFDTESLKQLYNNLNLAMNFEDFQFIQRYFQSEKRNPTDTEIQVLDTYWSDHCRHTTFETEITDVVFEKSPLTMVIENSFKDYLKTKHALNAKSLISLMDIATINAKYERQRGNLNDLELSEEVNAASIEIDVTVDNTVEKWYLMFKNETHNHPTEIEPFGGASTCIGGAIRDPLSGRSYVYAAMRITGAGDITMPIEDTLKGKLPQRVISKKAALGYASYGNQIGLPTTFVKELFHNGYVAKRMEIGAVLGAVKQTHLKRKSPQPGDVVLVLGGPTGRDGIGGATGSSKVHNQSSITEASSEVQKGNAPEERKLQRLFRHKKLSQKIKKANDFGAGGVSVAIGELAPGIKINLNKLPTKYFGMNGTELAISESQERMAVVIDKKDVRSFRYYCKKENIAVAYVADVTETPELTMVYNNKIICQLKRSFLDSSGIRQQQDVTITPYNMTQSLQPPFPGEELKAKLFSMLQHKNVASIQGLSELFDASIGRTTVLAPYGGKTMKTKTQASVHKIPVEHGNTSTVSIMAYGFDPDLAMIHPYLSSTYAVLESLAKVVATGGDYQRVRFTFQEYFERLNNDPVKWGKPLSALLGAYETLKQFGLAAVGGKDSMSGTYHDLDVPPTLVSFAVTTEDIKNIISPEFKAPNSHLYLFDFPKDSNQLPDFSVIKQNFNTLRKAQQQSHILSARAITFGGIAESLIKQSFGNQIGVNVSTVLPLFDKRYGAILVESNIPLASTHCHYLGRTTNDASLRINGVTLPIGTALTL